MTPPPPPPPAPPRALHRLTDAQQYSRAALQLGGEPHGTSPAAAPRPAVGMTATLPQPPTATTSHLAGLVSALGHIPAAVSGARSSSSPLHLLEAVLALPAGQQAECRPAMPCAATPPPPEAAAAADDGGGASSSRRNSPTRQGSCGPLGLHTRGRQRHREQQQTLRKAMEEHFGGAADDGGGGGGGSAAPSRRGSAAKLRHAANAASPPAPGAPLEKAARWAPDTATAADARGGGGGIGSGGASPPPPGPTCLSVLAGLLEDAAGAWAFGSCASLRILEGCLARQRGGGQLQGGPDAETAATTATAPPAPLTAPIPAAAAEGRPADTLPAAAQTPQAPLRVVEFFTSIPRAVEGPAWEGGGGDVCASPLWSPAAADGGGGGGVGGDPPPRRVPRLCEQQRAARQMTYTECLRRQRRLRAEADEAIREGGNLDEYLDFFRRGQQQQQRQGGGSPARRAQPGGGGGPHRRRHLGFFEGLADTPGADAAPAAAPCRSPAARRGAAAASSPHRSRHHHHHHPSTTPINGGASPQRGSPSAATATAPTAQQAWVRQAYREHLSTPAALRSSAAEAEDASPTALEMLSSMLRAERGGGGSAASSASSPARGSDKLRARRATRHLARRGGEPDVGDVAVFSADEAAAVEAAVERASSRRQGGGGGGSGAAVAAVRRRPAPCSPARGCRRAGCIVAERGTGAWVREDFVLASEGLPLRRCCADQLTTRQRTALEEGPKVKPPTLAGPSDRVQGASVAAVRQRRRSGAPAAAAETGGTRDPLKYQARIKPLALSRPYPAAAAAGGGGGGAARRRGGGGDVPAAASAAAPRKGGSPVAAVLHAPEVVAVAGVQGLQAVRGEIHRLQAIVRSRERALAAEHEDLFDETLDSSIFAFA